MRAFRGEEKGSWSNQVADTALHQRSRKSKVESSSLNSELKINSFIATNRELIADNWKLFKDDE